MRSVGRRHAEAVAAGHAETEAGKREIQRADATDVLNGLEIYLDRVIREQEADHVLKQTRDYSILYASKIGPIRAYLVPYEKEKPIFRVIDLPC